MCMPAHILLLFKKIYKPCKEKTTEIFGCNLKRGQTSEMFFLKKAKQSTSKLTKGWYYHYLLFNIITSALLLY